MKVSLTKVEPARKPTWLGWLLIASILTTLFFSFISNTYGFLAPQAPPHKGVMVVEGWMHDFALDEAITMYKLGDYDKIVCTGVPIETGNYLVQFKSFSEMTAARLRKLGIPENEIVVTTAELQKKDRTYLSAVALREAIMAYNIEGTDFHLVTTGPHGRRSRLLFQKALGDKYNIGITCLEDTGYESKHWYAYSMGVRKVIGESIAYLYAKFIFRP